MTRLTKTEKIVALVHVLKVERFKMGFLYTLSKGWHIATMHLSVYQFRVLD